LLIQIPNLVFRGVFQATLSHFAVSLQMIQKLMNLILLLDMVL